MRIKVVRFANVFAAKVACYFREIISFASLAAFVGFFLDFEFVLTAACKI